MSNVSVKDRKEEVEFLRMACNIADLGIDYLNADLIIRLQKRLKTKKGNFSIKDGVEVRQEWVNDWNKYFEEKSKEEENSSK